MVVMLNSNCRNLTLIENINKTEKIITFTGTAVIIISFIINPVFAIGESLYFLAGCTTGTVMVSKFILINKRNKLTGPNISPFFR